MPTQTAAWAYWIWPIASYCFAIFVFAYVDFLMEEGGTIFEFCARPITKTMKYRQSMFALFVFAVPIFLCIGFGMQEVDIIRDSYGAIIWFGVAAFLAAVLVIVWEDINLTGKWSKIIITALLEAFVLLLYFDGARWVATKAELASGREIMTIAGEMKTAGIYARWIDSQKHPVIVSTPGPQPISAPRPKPDVTLALIYPQRFATVILNRSSAIVNKALWSYVIWNLDRSDSFGNPQALPIPSQTADWIRPHSLVGPELTILASDPLLKSNDRLFGWIAVSCPDCVAQRGYWVFATVDKGGWFAEMKSGSYPDLSKMTREVMKAIVANPDQFLDSIQMGKKISIYSSLSDIPQN